MLVAEIRAGIALLIWPVVYYFLPSTFIPCFLSWQTAVYFAIAYKTQRLLSAGGHCPASRNLNGKVAVVSGANTGIGYETALHLAMLGATVFMACRSKDRAEEAIQRIRSKVKGAKVEFLKLDLGDFEQTRDAAKELSSKVEGTGIDILVMNAGIMDIAMGLPQKLPNGHEAHIGTNHLGTMLFTELCVPHVVKTKGRICIVSSIANKWCITYGKPGSGREATAPGALFKLVQDVEAETKKMDFNQPYGLSKAGNIIYAKSLAKRLASNGVTVTSVHPGGVQTELARSKKMRMATKPITQLVFKTPVEGAQTTLTCVLGPKIANGGFYADCVRHEDVVAPPVLDEVSGKQYLEWSFQQIRLPNPSK